MFLKKYSLSIFILVFFVCISKNAIAEIIDRHITDVTSRSFSIVFSSTESIVTPDVKVYSDTGGLNNLAIQSDTISTAQQHQNGLAIVRVHSLDSSTLYYFNVTDNKDLAIYYPSTNMPSVTTFPLAAINVSNQLVSNDVIKLDIYRPDQIASLEGAIALLSIPTVSAFPISASVGSDNFAYIDASNLKNGDADTPLLVEDGNIELKVLRGLLCDGAVDHMQVFYRKYGADLLDGPQVNLVKHCSKEDTVCDDQINVLDVQFVLNSLNSTSSECSFTGELDVVEDQQVNVLDLQQILNNF